MEVVNVIVTCSNRKSLPVLPGLGLGEHHGDIERRASSWTAALRQAGHQAPAGEVYCGGHWYVVQQLPDAAPDHCRVDTWVASAGYGLVNANDPIAAYQATFSLQGEDTVYSPAYGLASREVHRRWWTRLARWQGPNPGGPRTLEALASRYPDRPMLVAVSSAYLGALGDDLRAALDHLDSPELLSIVGREEHVDAPLHPWLVPFDARLQSLLGGARQSLYARVARKIVRESGTIPIRRSHLRAHYETILRQAPPARTYARRRQDDQALRAFIEHNLLEDRSLTHTGLLRRLRAAGKACEQSRFATLFREVHQEVCGG